MTRTKNLLPPLPTVGTTGTRPADQTRHYTIWLGGARVGTAVEAETWTATGPEGQLQPTNITFDIRDADGNLPETLQVVATEVQL